MKANRAFGRDDEGVSAVIGFVLVFGIVSTGFLMWSFNTLPVWIADNEQARDDAVIEAFGRIKGGLDGLSSTGQAGPIGVTVPLGASEVPLLQPAPSIGELSVRSGSGWSGSFQDTTTHLLGGRILGEPSQAIGASHALVDVVQVDALAIEIDTSGLDNGHEVGVRAVATDGNTTVTLEALHRDVGGTVCQASGNRHIRIQTVEGALTLGEEFQCGVRNTITDYRVDLLDAPFGFAAGLDRLSTPFNITLTPIEIGASLDEADLAAVVRGEDGVPVFVGSGTSTGDLARAANGNHLRFTPVNLHHHDERIAWEAGAVILDRHDQGAVVVDPSFDLRVDASTGYLSWTVVQATGSGNTGSSGSATATVAHLGTDRLLFETTGANITLTTPYPVSWERFFDLQALAAGAGDNVTVAAGADTVTLGLADAGVSTWVVDLRIVSASVTVS